MNALDYLLLTALVIAALYAFYRLFLGYMATRRLENGVACHSDVSASVRPDAEAANRKR
ncbi:MAG TPA: hypothetical protein VK633_06470 [Verrucomicrobiae bacterium]|nr:hypothetical protein [Verrucomicrobiae bacterium]